MKKNCNITAIEANTGFREKVIEKFVQKNLPPTSPRISKTSGMGGFASHYKEIEYCAAEFAVTGSVDISFASDSPDNLRHISCPVVSRFIVFCTREEKKSYKVAWHCSLS